MKGSFSYLSLKNIYTLWILTFINRILLGQKILEQYLYLIILKYIMQFKKCD